MVAEQQQQQQQQESLQILLLPGDLAALREKLQFHNTMTRQKEPFRPRKDLGNKVQMYVCGVTVYDFSHIGGLGRGRTEWGLAQCIQDKVEHKLGQTPFCALQHGVGRVGNAVKNRLLCKPGWVFWPWISVWNLLGGPCSKP
jgi:hypothetical protein